MTYWFVLLLLVFEINCSTVFVGSSSDFLNVVSNSTDAEIFISIQESFVLTDPIFISKGQNVIIDGNYFTLTTVSTLHFITVANGSTLTVNYWDFTGRYKPFIVEGTAAFSFSKFSRIKSYDVDSSVDGGVLYGGEDSIIYLNNCTMSANNAYVIFLFILNICK